MPVKGIIHQKEVIVVDATTGEIYGPKQRKIKRTEPFFMVTQEEAIALAKKGLSAREHDVLLYLQGIADYDNVAQVSQAHMAEQLKTTVVTICNVIKRLIALDIIETVQVQGRKAFKISSSISTRGKVKP